MVTKIPRKAGAPIKARTIVYKAIFQAMLLYGREIWLVTDAMMTMLEVFHHMISGRIADMTASKGNGGE